jgi:Zn-dependent peptidase ImmA (M78 family)
MIETLKIPIHRREAISQAVNQAYQDAEIDVDTLKPGIVPLYRLIQSYPISVDEIQDMTAQKVAEFLEAETGQTILIPEDKNCLLAGYLYLQQYQDSLYGCILTEKKPSAAPIFRRRFSAAHELGHYLLHFLPLLKINQNNPTIEPLIITEGLYNLRQEKDEKQEEAKQEMFNGKLLITNGLEAILEHLGIDRDLMEAEADCFAEELLIPEKGCYELAKRYQGRFGKKIDVLVGRLAPEFLVSKQAMKRRLESLKVMEKL